MMRFEKKPKVFLMVSLLQVIIRLSTIIMLVVFIKIGISGIFWGNIAGEIFGIVAISIYLRKYLSFSFDRKILSKLLLFSLPLLPGLLILGFQKPWANYIVQKNLSYADLGLYSLGLRVVSVFTIISYGLKMAWRPYLYEQVAKGDFSRDTKRIFNFFLVGLSFASIVLSIFAKEIIVLISTKDYLNAFMVIGFLSINALLQILRQIIGIGPEIKKKTYWITVSGVIQVFVTIGSLPFLLKAFGLVGIPLALMLGSLAAFIISWILTERMLAIHFPKYTIIISLSMLIAINVILLNFDFLIWQKILFIVLVLVTIGWRYNKFLKQVLSMIPEFNS
jgi:O-antigen/teichoic acid export membrane protein